MRKYILLLTIIIIFMIPLSLIGSLIMGNPSDFYSMFLINAISGSFAVLLANIALWYFDKNK